MNAKPVPLPAPEDLATERLLTAVESAIAGIRKQQQPQQPEYNGARK
jgi:hypothetical protein